MTRVRLTLLGRFSVELDGREISLPTRKAAALLAFLTLENGHARSRARLADLLWSHSGEDQARQSLRQSLFAVRKAMGDLDPFVAADEMISIDTELVSSDAIELLDAMEHGRTEEATSLYQGELLEGFELDEPPFDQWLAARRTDIREAAIELRLFELDHLVRAGEDKNAIHVALDLLQLDPLNEGAHRQLMRLYSRRGRVNEALRLYRELADRLQQQMRIAPQPETTQLYEEISERREQASTEAAAPATPLIIVVEDNALQRKLIVGILREAGYRVIPVDNGADALLEIGRSPCDLILLDIHLPMMDGLNILETVKRRDVPTPVILVSAEPAEKVEARALELGAADFIQKPVRKDALLARIRRVL